MVRGAIGVRINDGTTDRNVTRHVRGLKFAKQADGGHSTASLNVTLPLGTFHDLGPADLLTLTDTRHGGPLWDGYTEAPTPARGPGGEAFEVSALGGMVRAGDETRRFGWADTDLSSWTQFQGEGTARSANAGTATDPSLPEDTPGASQGLLLQLNPGSPVGFTQFAQIGYDQLERAGVDVGSVVLRVRSGKSRVSKDEYRAELAYPGGFTAIGAHISTDQTTAVLVAGAHFPEGTQTIALRLKRIGGATNVADDNTWSFFDRIAVVARRRDRYGNLTPVGAAGSVLASQVVEDLLGGPLAFADPDASVVVPTTRPIDQLTYPDGAAGQRVMDDLGDLEPDMLWEILHRTTTGPGGLHIMNYRPWATRPRYEISTRDGYTEPGGDIDLANRIAVTWTDKTGTTVVTTVEVSPSQYPALRALEDAGRTRDAESITLPEGHGSLANAEAIGAAILADTNTVATSATATIRRPVRDLYTDRWAMPWEIEPGYPALVRETGRTLRLTGMEYDDDTVSTAVTLGYPSRTRDQRLAALGMT